MLNVACISFSLGNEAANSSVVASRQATVVATSNSTRGGPAKAGASASHCKPAMTNSVTTELSRIRSIRLERNMNALLRVRDGCGDQASHKIDARAAQEWK